ncbi:shikimate dehydrogenase family protein [Ghiorsea bivora]|uniref:shikimate dehydrogenase family protein n=1 Tax=Ghiorsea bivora TaxID=1485545 RepID=UPI00056F8962|nr:shikimate dehydrogenase [Ghiorsea bivora]
MTVIHGKTSLYGIIGDPISHSLSPLFQNYFLEQAKQDAIYAPFHVLPDTLNLALLGLHASHIQGLNITVPHKETALALVDADDDARMIGAVNTIKRTVNGWLATNTDWQGFAAVLQGIQADMGNAPVLLFGAGGTAKAVIHALVQQGAKKIYICNRSIQRAEQLIHQTKRNYAVEIIHLAWQQEDINRVYTECKTIINTTSIGLKQNDTFPFSITGVGVAIDAVYKPQGKTAFTVAATAGDYHTTDGLPMLIAQGIASFAFWHHEAIQSGHLSLPDKLESLHWVERQLARQPLNLPGWGT